MPRAQVESLVASLSNRKSTYSPYGNNLVGGNVEYKHSNWSLTVNYSPGAPAPSIINQSGKSVTIPPIDEKVVSFHVELLK